MKTTPQIKYGDQSQEDGGVIRSAVTMSLRHHIKFNRYLHRGTLCVCNKERASTLHYGTYERPTDAMPESASRPMPAYGVVKVSSNSVHKLFVQFHKACLLALRLALCCYQWKQRLKKKCGDQSQEDGGVIRSTVTMSLWHHIKFNHYLHRGTLCVCNKERASILHCGTYERPTDAMPESASWPMPIRAPSPKNKWSLLMNHTQPTSHTTCAST